MSRSESIPGNTLESWVDSVYIPGKSLASWEESIQVSEILLESWVDLNQNSGNFLSRESIWIKFQKSILSRKLTWINFCKAIVSHELSRIKTFWDWVESNKKLSRTHVCTSQGQSSKNKILPILPSDKGYEMCRIVRFHSVITSTRKVSGHYDTFWKKKSDTVCWGLMHSGYLTLENRSLILFGQLCCWNDMLILFTRTGAYSDMNF